ncbi:DUF4845 domain-containing protein [Endothiovibrio diazotrophicus]
MRMPHKQRGMGLSGWMMMLVLIGFFTLLGLKIGPLYMEWGKVTTSLDGLAQELSTKMETKAKITDLLQRRLDVNSVEHVNLKEHLTLKRVKGGQMEITIAYEARVPLFKNLSAVADFSKTVTVGPGN